MCDGVGEKGIRERLVMEEVRVRMGVNGEEVIGEGGSGMGSGLGRGSLGRWWIVLEG